MGKDMGKHSHIGLVGGTAPCALLLGALVFPTTVLSQASESNDARFAPPAQQQNQYGGAKAYGTTPSNFPEATQFQGQMSSPGGYYGSNHGPNFGYGYGMAPFDKGNPSAQPPSQGNWGGTSAPMSMPPMQQGTPGHGMMGYGKAPNAPYAGQQGGKPCSEMGSFGCGHKHLMGHGGMGMRHQGMGKGVWQLFQIPNLTDEQRGKIHDISDELRHNHWKLMGERMEHAAQLRRLYQAEPLDAKAIGAIYAKIFDAKRKAIEADIEATQKAKDILTDDQRKQFQSWKR